MCAPPSARSCCCALCNRGRYIYIYNEDIYIYINRRQEAQLQLHRWPLPAAPPTARRAEWLSTPTYMPPTPWPPNPASQPPTHPTHTPPPSRPATPTERRVVAEHHQGVPTRLRGRGLRHAHGAVLHAAHAIQSLRGCGCGCGCDGGGAVSQGTRLAWESRRGVSAHTRPLWAPP